MRLGFVDNYDSFSHNLIDLLEQLGAKCDVVQNDGLDLEQLAALAVDGFVVSPGPCTPAESGISLPLCELAVSGALGRPLLGVCLGHQAIATALGGHVVRALRPMHGKVSHVAHDGLGLFEALDQPLTMARYNSLTVDATRLPAELEVTAWSEEREVMALAHRSLPIVGIQFHPESHLSKQGDRLLQNWLRSLVSNVEELG